VLIQPPVSLYSKPHIRLIQAEFLFPPCDFSACLLVLASFLIACRMGTLVAGVAHRKGVATREEVYQLLRCSASGLLKSNRQRLLFP